jgi:hypothetical protein
MSGLRTGVRPACTAKSPRPAHSAMLRTFGTSELLARNLVRTKQINSRCEKSSRTGLVGRVAPRRRCCWLIRLAPGPRAPCPVPRVPGRGSRSAQGRVAGVVIPATGMPGRPSVRPSGSGIRGRPAIRWPALWADPAVRIRHPRQAGDPLACPLGRSGRPEGHLSIGCDHFPHLSIASDQFLSNFVLICPAEVIERWPCPGRDGRREMPAGLKIWMMSISSPLSGSRPRN